MRSLLTGYAGAFNRRQKRVGHLFQCRTTAAVLCRAVPWLRGGNRQYPFAGPDVVEELLDLCVLFRHVLEEVPEDDIGIREDTTASGHESPSPTPFHGLHAAACWARRISQARRRHFGPAHDATSLLVSSAFPGQIVMQMGCTVNRVRSRSCRQTGRPISAPAWTGHSFSPHPPAR